MSTLATELTGDLVGPLVADLGHQRPRRLRRRKPPANAVFLGTTAIVHNGQPVIFGA